MHMCSVTMVYSDCYENFYEVEPSTIILVQDNLFLELNFSVTVTSILRIIFIFQTIRDFIVYIIFSIVNVALNFFSLYHSALKLFYLFPEMYCGRFLFLEGGKMCNCSLCNNNERNYLLKLNIKNLKNS